MVAMARPGFTDHPKFRRLCHLLREPEPHVWGYMEFLWLTGYQHGNPVLGPATDVELAAKYPGMPGRLFEALLACRFIEPLRAVEGGALRPDVLEQEVAGQSLGKGVEDVWALASVG